MSAQNVVLLHITTEDTWQCALLAGYYAPAQFAAEGFIHLSTIDQVITVANRFYRGLSRAILLTIDPHRLQGEVRYEPGDDGAWFPHLYGVLNLDAVIAVQPFTPDNSGTYILPGFLADMLP